MRVEAAAYHPAESATNLPVENDPANPPAFADYVRPVWQRKWLVIFVVILATAGAYALSVRQPKIYTTGTLVYYQPGSDPLNNGATFASDRTLEDVAGLLYAQDAAVLVAKQIKFPGTPGQLLAAVTISAKPGQDFVAISGTSRDPRLAAAIANGYARYLVSVTNSDQVRLVSQELASLGKQLARTSTGPAGQAARQALVEQIGKLQLALAVPTGTRQVSSAATPLVPTSPKPKRDAIFAFVLSLALAIAVAFGFERFDRRLKRPEDLEGAYGRPLLAVLPHSADPAPNHDGVVGLDPGFHEAFGLLRTNIQLLTLDAPPRSLVVVSAIPGEGKSTVVRNLAIAMAEAGKRVVVVEADLRRPMQSGLFGLPAGPGFTEVLTGAATLSEVLRSVPARARGIDTLSRIEAGVPSVASRNGHPGDSGEAAIFVLLAGARPPNPATVLESVRTLEILDELSATHDIVILDSAPMLSVTDSVPLIRYADAAILVGRLSLTTRDSVRRMTAFLERVPDTRVLGIIANDLSELDSGSYGYGDHYGYGGYGSEAVPSPKGKRKRAAAADKRATATEHV